MPATPIAVLVMPGTPWKRNLMDRLLLLGLNHTTAPLELRERLAFGAAQARDAVRALREHYPHCEFVLLSTCNRVELYAARPIHSQPRFEQMAEFLASFRDTPLERFSNYLYQRAGDDVVTHLFSVASSLDSMVIGESQIIGQVRGAYEMSRELGAAGDTLHSLFQRAIAVGREVRHTTSLGEGRVSVSGVAVDYAKRIFNHFHDKTVLCVGAGEMGVLALRGFAALRPKQLLVCGRDGERARRVASEFDGMGASFDTLEQQLIDADIVITSTGATEPIIRRAQFERLLRLRRQRPIFIIDIAMPRDVEPTVGELEHVHLYNLDDLQHAVGETHAQRGAEIENAKAVVARHVEQYIAARRQREVGPVIDQLYRRLHAMAAEEVGRTINRMADASDAEKQHLQELARRIVNKVLHDPIKALRDGDPTRASPGHYVHAIERLFKLNEGGGDEPAQSGRDDDAG